MPGAERCRKGIVIDVDHDSCVEQYSLFCKEASFIGDWRQLVSDSGDDRDPCRIGAINYQIGNSLIDQGGRIRIASGVHQLSYRRERNGVGDVQVSGREYISHWWMMGVFLHFWGVFMLIWNSIIVIHGFIGLIILIYGFMVHIIPSYGDKGIFFSHF